MQYVCLYLHISTYIYIYNCLFIYQAAKRYIYIYIFLNNLPANSHQWPSYLLGCCYEPVMDPTGLWWSGLSNNDDQKMGQMITTKIGCPSQFCPNWMKWCPKKLLNDDHPIWQGTKKKPCRAWEKRANKWVDVGQTRMRNQWCPHAGKIGNRLNAMCIHVLSFTYWSVYVSFALYLSSSKWKKDIYDQ